MRVGSRWRKAPGYTTLGTDPDEGVPGWTLYPHRILSDEEVLVKEIGGKLKFLDEVTNTFHLLTDAVFTDRRFWFDTFNGYMYGGNGVDNFLRWRGSAWSTLNGAVLAGATTIDLATGTGARYASTGSGMIEGDTFSWGGRTGDQLTSVTGLTSAHADGSRVITKIDSSTYTTQPKGSVGLIFKNRLFVRDDANPNFWYFSKLADNTTPEDDLANFTIAGSGSGDAGFIIFPAQVLAARKFIDGANNAVQVVFCADGQSYAVSVTDTGGATVGIYVPFKNIGADVAGTECVAATENELVLMDARGAIRSLGYGDQSTTLKSARLSDRIEPSLDPQLVDFSDGVVRYFDKRVLAIGKARWALFKEEPNYNNVIIVKDSSPDAFDFWDHLPANDIVEWKNLIVAIDSVNGKVYRMFHGRSAAGANIPLRYDWPKLDHGAPLIYKLLRKIRIKGAFLKGGSFEYNAVFDDAQNPIVFDVVEGQDKINDKNNPGVCYGSVKYGAVGFGGATAGDAWIPFTLDLNLPADRFYLYVKPYIVHNDKDTDLEIHSQLFYAEVQDPNLEVTGKQLSQS